MYGRLVVIGKTAERCARLLSNPKRKILGAFPLEGMDLVVHPKLQEVTGAHSDKIARMVKRYSPLAKARGSMQAVEAWGKVKARR